MRNDLVARELQSQQRRFVFETNQHRSLVVALTSFQAKSQTWPFLDKAVLLEGLRGVMRIETARDLLVVMADSGRVYQWPQHFD